MFYNFSDFYSNSAVKQDLRIFENLKKFGGTAKVPDNVKKFKAYVILEPAANL
jgi:hypothetical protein